MTDTTATPASDALDTRLLSMIHAAATAAAEQPQPGDSEPLLQRVAANGMLRNCRASWHVEVAAKAIADERCGDLLAVVLCELADLTPGMTGVRLYSEGATDDRGGFFTAVHGNVVMADEAEPGSLSDEQYDEDDANEAVAVLLAQFGAGDLHNGDDELTLTVQTLRQRAAAALEAAA